MSHSPMKLRIYGLIVLLSMFANGDRVNAQSSSGKTFESYFLYLDTYPNGAVSWGEAGREVQGITTDGSYWYITATERCGMIDFDICTAYLWKIPLEEDLNSNVFSNPNIGTKTLWDLPDLWNNDSTTYDKFCRRDTCGWGCVKDTCFYLPNTHIYTGYIHWGDLDHYHYSSGHDYLVVPVTSPKKKPSPAIVFFDAASLNIIGIGGLPRQKDIGWCAVNPQSGNLFTSNDLTSVLYEYQVPWDLLMTKGYMDFELVLRDSMNLLDASGDRILTLHNMQGGEFSPTGDLLYLSNGRGKCVFGAEDSGDPQDGINVFDTTTWERIKQSTNRCWSPLRNYYTGTVDSTKGVSDCDHDWTDYFDFTFDFGCGTFESHSDQPQGLTIWDLDGRGVPYISGQLHVLTAAIGLWGNMATLCHYSRKIVADASRINTPVFGYPTMGSDAKPFSSLNEAYYWYPAWDGSEIVLEAGVYSETGVFSSNNRIRITSRGGTAIVGQRQ